jgi:hypothetical protein
MESRGVIGAIQALTLVQEAVTRIPDKYRGKVTFFSVNDIWLYDTNPIETTCVACKELDGSEWTGASLRAPFTWLEILDLNTIYPATHPNCRCLFHRQPPISLFEVP